MGAICSGFLMNFFISRTSRRGRSVSVFLIPFVLILSIPHGAAAEQTTNVLPVTVVTASRYEQPIESVVSDVIVIDRSEIERYGAATIDEVLSHLPGIQSVGVGAPQIFIRGANANMTAVYIDGVRIDPQDKNSGNPELSLVNLAQVERIEIIRGPASDVYGAKAVGGVIQIFTDGGARGKWANVGLGSEGLRTGGFGLSGDMGEQLQYRFGLRQAISDGYDQLPSTDNVTSNMPWRDMALNAGLNYQLSAVHTLKYVLNASERDAESAPDSGTSNSRKWSGLVASGLSWDATWSDQWATQVGVNTSRLDYTSTLPDTYVTSGHGLTISAQKKFELGLLSLGLERKLDRLDAASDIYNSVAIAQTRSQNGSSLAWASQVRNLSFKLGTRYDDDEKFGGQSSSNIAASVQITPHVDISVGLATAFRAPSIEQTTGSYGASTLSPEESISKDIKLAYESGSDAIQMVVFRSDYTSMISTSGTSCSAGFFCYENISSAKVEGLTFSGKTMVGVASISGSVDALRARNNETNLPLNYRADETATLEISAPLAGWQLGGQWRAVGERYYYSGAARLRGYGLLNMYASRAIAPGWTLQTRVNNAHDREYDGDGYYATPGRVWFVGLKWQER